MLSVLTTHTHTHTNTHASNNNNNNNKGGRRKLRDDEKGYGLHGGDGFMDVYFFPNLMNCITLKL